jgi:predicted AAA+ superfamily ATPase
MSQRILDTLNRHLIDYLNFGGFPEVVTIDQPNRIRVLQDYVDVVVFRDVVERHKVTNISLAKYLVRTMLRNASKLFSYHKLYNDLKSQGLKVSKNTLYEYIGYFEDAYLFFTIPLWSDSLRKVQSNPKKIYAIDPGLATAFNADFSPNLGLMFENLIYLDLRRRGYDIYYYRTKGKREVDFYAKAPVGKDLLLQACYDLSDKKTAARELQALEEGEQELGLKGMIITPHTYHSLFDTM